MRRWFGRIGLALSLAAYALLAFHVDHADADHGGPEHHCCPCHVYTNTPNAAAAVVERTSAVERVVDARERDSAAAFIRFPGSPRAPPVA